MTVRHPVPDELLLDYAVGSTGPGKTLLVATHLAMCPASRRRYAMLQQVGAALAHSLTGRSLDRISAESVLAHAESYASRAEDVTARRRPCPPAAAPRLGGKLRELRVPAPLASFAREVVDSRAWRQLGIGVEAAVLSSVSTGQGRTRILRLRRGTRIVRHTHEGEVLALVLQGAVWDAGERFGAGDVAVSDGPATRAPVIDDAEDCWCLAVTAGSIKFVGRYGWLLNMLNRF